MRTSIFLLLILVSLQSFSQDKCRICVISSVDQSPVTEASIFLDGLGFGPINNDGCQSILLAEKEYQLSVKAEGFQIYQQNVMLNNSLELEIVLSPYDENHTEEMDAVIQLSNLGLIQLDDALIEVTDLNYYKLQKMSSVENFAIYASKKSEVISPASGISNNSQNQARQTFSKFSGLNIWDDASGLQLNIGARGLDPSRSANFAIRQGGFDISADPLGYPESYYTPPMQAVERIELVRGTGALQYGSQFGGLLNFKMNQGNKKKKLEYKGELGAASFNTFHSFQSLGGQIKNFNYFIAHSYRESEGWRPNSGFNSHSLFTGFNYDFSINTSLKLEFSHMNYLAQQPGGLTNSEFLNTPNISKRERNWFAVDWNTLGLELKHQFTDRTKVQWKVFGLLSSRKALGFLGPVSRIDPLDSRELISGTFENYGTELKLEHRYQIGDKYAVLLTGIRHFRGNTNSSQGFADDGDGPSFNFTEEGLLSGSDFDFKTDNQAFFIEQLIYLNEKLSLNPGFRMERIVTGFDGYYSTILRDGAGNVLPGYPIYTQNESSKSRFVPLFGLGMQYSMSPRQEFYMNITQNYRAVNFSDLYVTIPGLKVDENLIDESGFSGDIGWRWKPSEKTSFEGTLFWLEYKDRIGVIYKRIEDPVLGSQAVQFRSNLADARSLGIEVNSSITLFDRQLFGLDHFKWIAQFSGSYIKANYINGPADLKGNTIENVPSYNARISQLFSWRNWKLQLSFNHTALQYSDAGNAPFNADINAVAGEIPAYTIVDLAASWEWKHWNVGAGVNNALNQSYFTRRAAGYPGPGIIPSDPRSYFVKLGWRF